MSTASTRICTIKVVRLELNVKRLTFYKCFVINNGQMISTKGNEVVEPVTWEVVR